MKRLLSLTLAALAFCAASSVCAQTWTVTGLDSLGCNSGDTGFAINFSGVSAGDWYFDTTVDAAGQRFMDEYLHGTSLIVASVWHLYDENVRGLQTQNFPLPPNTPITVTLTLRDSTQTPVYRTVVTLSQCNAGGTITSNVSTPLPRGGGGGNATSVPTLGEWSLLALGAAAMTLGARRLRRRRA